MEVITCLQKLALYAVRKDEWDTEEGTGKSMQSVKQYGKRYTSQAKAMSNKKNQAHSLSLH